MMLWLFLRRDGATRGGSPKALPKMSRIKSHCAFSSGALVASGVPTLTQAVASAASITMSRRLSLLTATAAREAGVLFPVGDGTAIAEAHALTLAAANASAVVCPSA